METFWEKRGQVLESGFIIIIRRSISSIDI